MIVSRETEDPFANIGDTDPGEVSGKEYTKMASKLLATGALPTAKPAFRLSTFATVGEFTPLDDIAGQEVMLHSFDLMHSDTYNTDFYKTGATDSEGAVHTLALGQQMIKPAIDALLGDCKAQGLEVPFPIAVRFVKKGRAWSIE